MAINFGKDKETLFASTDLMSFGKAFSRMAAQPLDMYEVWYDLTALENYAASGETAYVGQKVVYIDADNKVTHYSIEANGSLKELGTTPIGDNKSVVVDENGTISLKGVSALAFEREVEGETVEVKFQPLMTKDGLVWVEPSKTTVEGLAVLIEELTGRVSALETKVGKAAEGEEEATGLFKAVADEVARAEAAEKALGERIDAIDYVDAEELATELAPYAKSADVVSNADYAVDKKAFQDEDAAIRAIAEGARDAIDSFLTSENIDETVNTLKEIQIEIEKMTDATELAEALAHKADKTDLNNYVTNEVYNAHLTAQSNKDSAQDQALETYKGQVTELLAGKQDVIAENTYDAYGAAATAKSEAIADADAKLANKANVSDVYTKAQTYSNEEIDELLENIQAGSSESAASVKTQLDSYKKVVNAEVWGNEEGSGDSRIDVLEANKINSVAAAEGAKLVVNTSTDKKVTIDDSAIVGLISTAQSKANSAYDVASNNKTELERIAPIVSSNNTAVTEQGGKITTLETKVSTLETKASTLESNVGTNVNEISSLKTTVGNHATKFGEIDTALDNIRTDIGTNSASVTTLKGQLKGIETAEGSVLALIEEAKKAGTDADAAAKAAKSVADSAVAGVNLNAGNITTLIGRVDGIDGEITTLKGNVTTINGRLDTIEGNATALTGRVDTVEGKVSTLESQITGLSGAMHFRGISSVDPMGENGPSIEGIESYASGDVVIFSGKEYVYDGSAWHLFGDEGSYALKDSVYTKSEIDTKVSTIETNYTAAIGTAKQEAINAAAADATSKADKALADAKAYVDEALSWTAMEDLAE